MSTASPPRNFTIPLAERIRGLHGPPAYSVRLREIEDIEERLAKRLRQLVARATAAGADARAARAEALRRVPKKDHARLVELVARHNAYYPVEANLPMQPGTGILLDGGEPFRPRVAPSLDELLERGLRGA